MKTIGCELRNSFINDKDMYDYFIFENRKTKERLVIKENNKVLKIFKIKNRTVVGRVIEESVFNVLRSNPNIKFVGRFKSQGKMPSPIIFIATEIRII